MAHGLVAEALRIGRDGDIERLASGSMGPHQIGKTAFRAEVVTPEARKGLLAGPSAAPLIE